MAGVDIKVTTQSAQQQLQALNASISQVSVKLADLVNQSDALGRKLGANVNIGDLGFNSISAKARTALSGLASTVGSKFNEIQAKAKAFAQSVNESFAQVGAAQAGKLFGSQVEMISRALASANTQTQRFAQSQLRLLQQSGAVDAAFTKQVTQIGNLVRAFSNESISLDQLRAKLNDIAKSQIQAPVAMNFTGFGDAARAAEQQGIANARIASTLSSFGPQQGTGQQVQQLALDMQNLGAHEAALAQQHMRLMVDTGLLSSEDAKLATNLSKLSQLYREGAINASSYESQVAKLSTPLHFEGFAQAGKAAIDFKQKQDEAANSSKRFGVALTDLSRTLQLAYGPLSGIAFRVTTFGELAAKAPALSILAIATVGLGVAFHKAVEEGKAFQQFNTQISELLNTTAAGVGLTATQVEGLTESIKKLTLLPIDQIRDSARALLAFPGLSGDVFERTLRSAADIAAVFGDEMPSAARRLGRALEEPAQNLEAITRLGVTFNRMEKEQIQLLQDTGRLQEARGLILSKVEAHVRGAAEAAGKNTLAGATNDASNAFRELFETISVKSGLLDSMRINMEKIATALRSPGIQQAGASLGQLFKGLSSSGATGNTALFAAQHLDVGGAAVTGLLLGQLTKVIIKQFEPMVALVKQIGVRIGATGAAEAGAVTGAEIVGGEAAAGGLAALGIGGTVAAIIPFVVAALPILVAAVLAYMEAKKSAETPEDRSRRARELENTTSASGPRNLFEYLGALTSHGLGGAISTAESTYARARGDAALSAKLAQQNKDAARDAIRPDLDALKGLHDSITEQRNAIAKFQGLNPALVTSIMQQENAKHDPNLVSPRGAIGLMQVLPSTAREFGVSAEQLKDGATNINTGSQYYISLLKKYGNALDASIAYNEGPGNFDKGIRDKGAVAYAHRVVAGAGLTGAEGPGQLLQSLGDTKELEELQKSLAATTDQYNKLYAVVEKGSKAGREGLEELRKGYATASAQATVELIKAQAAAQSQLAANNLLNEQDAAEKLISTYDHLGMTLHTTAIAAQQLALYSKIGEKALLLPPGALSRAEFNRQQELPENKLAQQNVTATFGEYAKSLTGDELLQARARVQALNLALQEGAAISDKYGRNISGAFLATGRMQDINDPVSKGILQTALNNTINQQHLAALGTLSDEVSKLNDQTDQLHAQFDALNQLKTARQAAVEFSKIQSDLDAKGVVLTKEQASGLEKLIQLQASATEQLKRYDETAKSLSDTFKNVFDKVNDLFDKVSSGPDLFGKRGKEKSAAVREWKASIEKGFESDLPQMISKQFTQFAITNPIRNLLFPGEHQTTLSDIVKHLTGADKGALNKTLDEATKQGNAIAQALKTQLAVATMNVTGAVVNVNGGTGAGAAGSSASGWHIDKNGSLVPANPNTLPSGLGSYLGGSPFGNFAGGGVAVNNSNFVNPYDPTSILGGGGSFGGLIPFDSITSGLTGASNGTGLSSFAGLLNGGSLSGLFSSIFGGGGSGGIGGLFSSLFSGGGLGGLSSIFSSLFSGGGLSSIFGSLSSLLPSLLAFLAKGDVLQRGAQLHFASGDIFHRPATFPMSHGRTGMLGENGPEAVMPLSRTSGGMLGVTAIHSSQSQQTADPVHIQIINHTGEAVTARRTGTRGAQIQIGNAVVDDLENGGPVAKSIEKNYVLQRRTIPR